MKDALAIHHATLETAATAAEAASAALDSAVAEGGNLNFNQVCNVQRHVVSTMNWVYPLVAET